MDCVYHISTATWLLRCQSKCIQKFQLQLLSKFTPIMQVSLLHIELMRTQLLFNLMTYITEAFTDTIEDILLWTDSYIYLDQLPDHADEQHLQLTVLQTSSINTSVDIGIMYHLNCSPLILLHVVKNLKNFMIIFMQLGSVFLSLSHEF